MTGYFAGGKMLSCSTESYKGPTKRCHASKATRVLHEDKNWQPVMSHWKWALLALLGSLETTDLAYVAPKL